MSDLVFSIFRQRAQPAIRDVESHGAEGGHLAEAELRGAVSRQPHGSIQVKPLIKEFIKVEIS